LFFVSPGTICHRADFTIHCILDFVVHAVALSYVSPGTTCQRSD
jgi:hypothetical protein